MLEAIKKIVRPEEPNKIDHIIGTTIIIYPSNLHNRGRLFTTQDIISLPKLRYALEGLPDFETETPKGWIGVKKGQIFYVVGDGNHRIALACINGDEIPFFIKGKWGNNARIFGFNKIISQVRSELGCSL